MKLPQFIEAIKKRSFLIYGYRFQIIDVDLLMETNFHAIENYEYAPSFTETTINLKLMDRWAVPEHLLENRFRDLFQKYFNVHGLIVKINHNPSDSYRFRLI